MCIRDRPCSVPDVNELLLFVCGQSFFGFDCLGEGFHQQRKFFVTVVAGVEVGHFLGQDTADDAEECPAAVVGGVFYGIGDDVYKRQDL